MELHNLKPSEGAFKRKKRIGRGQGSGKGGTSTKGHKGAKSRSGYKSKLGFEGGQMPLQRRVPKFGFKNVNRKEFTGVNLDLIQSLIDQHKVESIDKDFLVAKGLVSKNERIKILGRGELTTKVDIKVDAFSKSAIAAIEKLGGKAETI